MRNKWYYCLLVLVCVSLLTACTQSPGDRGDHKKHIHFLYNFSTKSLDPHVDLSYVPLRAGITETLVRLDEEDLTIAPWLAESWSSEDGQHWTIKLREDVTFQNGKKMDAKAVKTSLERALKESIAIQNALKIDTIVADEYTLNITTKEPFPAFVSELVHPNVSIIDVTEEDIINKPVGTGPFKLKSFTPGSKLVVERYANYWDGASNLDSVTFAFNEDANARTLALKSGQVDIVFRPEVESLDMLREIDGMKVESTATLRAHQIFMNMDRKSMQDVNVRRAVDALINRQKIVDSILHGYGETAVGPFHPSLPFAPTFEERATGKDAAVKYLEEAGYTLKDGKMQKDGETLQFTLLTYSARAELPLIAQVFQSEAKQIGIDVKIQLIESPEEYMTSNRDWDLATYSILTAPRGDAGYFLNATFHPTGALNFSAVNDPKLTSIIDKLNTTVSLEDRTALSKQAAIYIYDNAINSYFLHPDTNVAYNDKKVKNWVTSLSEYYMITNRLDVK
jgi:peptide/nickel transport system substrate-binding protein